MAQNPLLGSRISLISKKNIRYEGTLYSINESNATVALQNVRSYGTEGREKLDPSATFVAPQDAVHPYLLFRGCDIKDLHVHESAVQQPPPNPATIAAETPANNNQRPPETTQAAGPPQQTSLQEMPAQENALAGLPHEPNGGSESQDNSDTNGDARKKGNNNRAKKKNHPGHQVGTGASLLNRKVRGTKDGGLTDTPSDDFDFQSKLKEFDKEHEEGDEEAGDIPQPINATVAPSYEKDDFFDSISCDAIDRQAGIDNRLRGSAERNLNTETFGAVALNSQRRRRRYTRGGGGGREGNRSSEGENNNGGDGGGGRGRGRGRGRGGRGRGRGRGGIARGGASKENRQPS